MGYTRREILGRAAAACVAAGLTRRLQAAPEVDRSSPATPFTPRALSWRGLAPGLEFARQAIESGGDHVDTVALTRFDPRHYQLGMHTGYHSPGRCELLDVEEWRRRLGAWAVWNNLQYMAEPYGKPVAAVISGGEIIGPRHNRRVRGMLVAEPRRAGMPPADLLDFKFDTYDLSSGRYREGVQHWPILLDREGRVRVDESGRRAQRTVVAKDRAGRILFLVTESSFFSLAVLGFYLRHSGLDIHTAMNLDGGAQASVSIAAPSFRYRTTGYLQGDQPAADPHVLRARQARVPAVISLKPR